MSPHTPFNEHLGSCRPLFSVLLSGDHQTPSLRMEICTISANTGALQPPAINIIGAEPSELEQLNAQPSGIDADDSSPRNSRSSFYFSSGLSPLATDRLSDEEGSDDDECIVRCHASPSPSTLPTLTASRRNSSSMTMVNRCAISARIPRFAFAIRCLTLQSEPLVHPPRWCPTGFFNLTSTNFVQ